MRFDSYHPAINLLYFAAVLAGAIIFDHPAAVAISFAAALIYSVRLNGKKALVFDLILIPVAAGFALLYASYQHFGVTVLFRNAIGNDVTVESLVYGGILGGIGAAVLMWLSCVNAVMTTDKVIYLTGRIWPRLSLFLSVILRTVPRLKFRAKKILEAQRSIGKSGFRNIFRVFSILLTWMLENFAETADSMRSRGYSLRGRTAYSQIRFDGRDRAALLGMTLCMAIVLMGAFLDQLTAVYDPEIRILPMMPLSILFYAAYAALCMMPVGLELAAEAHHRHRLKTA